MEELNIRLREALEIREMKPSELAEKAGIARGTISHYLSGSMVPKSKRIYAIAQILKVQPAWLIGYDVPMEAPTEHPEVVSSIQKMFDQLNPDEQRTVMTMLSVLVNKKEPHTDQQ